VAVLVDVLELLILLAGLNKRTHRAKGMAPAAAPEQVGVEILAPAAAAAVMLFLMSPDLHREAPYQ
jgi:hypothetical protein